MLLALALPAAGAASRRIPIDRLRHFECFDIVRSVSRAVRQGKDDATIAQELTAQCDKAPGARRDICAVIVPARIPDIRAKIAGTSRPDVVCEAIGYPRPFATTRLIAPAQCEQYVDLARLVAGANAPARAAPGRKADLLAKTGFLAPTKACKRFGEERRATCQTVLRLVMRGLQSDLEKGVDSATLCQRLHDRHLIKLLNATAKS